MHRCWLNEERWRDQSIHPLHSRLYADIEGDFSKETRRRLEDENVGKRRESEMETSDRSPSRVLKGCHRCGWMCCQRQSCLTEEWNLNYCCQGGARGFHNTQRLPVCLHEPKSITRAKETPIHCHLPLKTGVGWYLQQCVCIVRSKRAASFPLWLKPPT